VTHTLQNMMEKDGMSFTRVRSPKKNDVRLFDFAVGAGAPSRTENRRQTGDARGVSSPVTAINVVAADDRADEFLRDVIKLIGGFGAAEHAEGARSVLANFAADGIRNTIESFFPRCKTMFSLFAD